MLRPYRYLSVAILGLGAASAATIAGVRLVHTHHSTINARGRTPASIRANAGYSPWDPSYVPAGMRRVGTYAIVRGDIVGSAYGGRIDATDLSREVLIAMAPSGRLTGGMSGINFDRRSVRVHQAAGTLDSWSGAGSEPSNEHDPGHHFRILAWSEHGLAFALQARDVPDDELVKIANSMAPTS